MTFNRTNLTRRGRRPRRRHPRGFTWAVIAMLLVSAALLALTFVQRSDDEGSRSGALEDETRATIAIFDVGQALSAAIVTSDGASLVYDFGLSRDGAENVIMPFLRDHGVDRIDYAILSHPHQDHLGGLPALIESMPIDLFIDPVLETTNQTYFQSLQMIEERQIDVAMARRGDRYALGESATIEILWPGDDLLRDSDGTNRINDNSAVAKITIGEVQVMLTGDIEQDAEDVLVDELGRELDVEILQIAHHGSNSSSQDTFLDAARPDVGVIPVGENNQYGHPHSEVMQRLRARGIQIYRTDVDGTVIIRTDGQTYEIETSRSDASWTSHASLRRSTISKRMPMGVPSRYSSLTIASN